MPSHGSIDFEDWQATTKDAGDDITAFMSIFFEHFTKFKGRALHLAGESYGVRTLLLPGLDDVKTNVLTAGSLHPRLRVCNLRQ